jgi:hypothetical protein
MFKCWLTEVKGKNHSAYCKGCKKEITAVLTALRKYHSSAYHQTRIRELQIPFSSRIDTIFRGQGYENESVKEAELRLAAFLSEHNLSFHIMDHFSDLLPKLFPDSKIAANFKCKRTKSKSIVTNALAPHFHKNLVDDLKVNSFSLIIDETTDLSTKKGACISYSTVLHEGKTCKMFTVLVD